MAFLLTILSSMLSAKRFEMIFAEWTKSLKDGDIDVDVIAIDGKTVRGSKDSYHKKAPIHLVNAWASNNELILGQCKSDGKSNKITAIQLLLDLLDIEGSIITIDAMGTQTKIAETIVDNKADIFEGGHRVPFILRWPEKIKAGTAYDKTCCTTDFMATAAEIAGQKLSDNEGEDNYSLMPIFNDPETPDYKREYTIHHSINGSFSIRKGNWKLELCPGSGGWSDPRPKKAREMGLPEIQLYDLSTDIAEQHNVYDKHPEKVKELYNLLLKCINDGRSTPGAPQTNDPALNGKWPQLQKLEKLKHSKYINE